MFLHKPWRELGDSSYIRLRALDTCLLSSIRICTILFPHLPFFPFLFET